MRTSMMSYLLAGVVLAGFGADASAKPKKHPAKVAALRDLDTSSLNAIPLTVNRRSWLDSGNVVRSDSNTGGRAYIAASTQFNLTEDRIIDPDKFGNDVIVGQPYVPGSTVSVAEFSTYPNGTARLDNVLGPQNFYFNPAPPELPSRPAAVPFFPTR